MEKEGLRASDSLTLEAMEKRWGLKWYREGNSERMVFKSSSDGFQEETHCNLVKCCMSIKMRKETWPLI